MGSSTSLRDVSEHFAFGANWSSFARTIDEEKIRRAADGLVRLLGPDALRGRSFLDIGCGSGIHALAAIRLGAVRVLAVDLDPRSVGTARAVLSAFAPAAAWDCRELSVFDLDRARLGGFDIVYSWGVLHHTGALHEALAKAAAIVAEDGRLCVALYRKTRLCRFWRIEKRLYARAPAILQGLVRRLYVLLFRLGLAASGRRWKTYRDTSVSRRGMDFQHDVHDWLGGFPYESITPEATEQAMRQLGFAPVRSFTRPGGLGLFGSGCDEYVFRRI